MPIFPQFSSAPAALAIFCRAPRLGTVKTRLAATRGPQFTLGLYRAMLADSFDLGRALAPAVESVACFTPADAFDDDSLAELWNGPKLAQCDGDLGAKMLDCFAQLRSRGYEKAVIIGSDSPDLPLKRLQKAFEILENEPLVVGQSFDGGFYLIGAAIEFPAALFEDMVWSSNTVFERLMRNAAPLSPIFPLPSWRDVDDEADLLELRRRIFDLGTHAPKTCQFLEENLAQRRKSTEI